MPALYRYRDLIQQTFDFPTEEFSLSPDGLQFHGIPLMDLVKKHGTPMRITYLPKVGSQINKARKLFADAFKKHNYPGSYTYCYCTKSSHFSFIMEEVLENGAHIETSSAFDLALVRKLYERGKITKDHYIVCNGFKRPLYQQYITELIEDGFNCVPILDNVREIEAYTAKVAKPFRVGMRLAADEEPNFEFYTSRLGIRYQDAVSVYEEKIAPNPNVELHMLHYFINTGIKDTSYYWSELSRFVRMYCELRRRCPTLTMMDIGGGLPIKTSLAWEYDFKYMIEEIVEVIQRICEEQGVPCPDLFTEFGSFTVGESGAIIYGVLDEKYQNDKELWYMIDSSFITTLPDCWALNQRYILMALNQWNQPYHHVNLGGLTCDSMDYYNSESHHYQVFMPQRVPEEPLYIGFFHTGAYQESLGGYGGIQHCLIPAPKHVVIRRDKDGKWHDEVFANEQPEEKMMEILGY